MAAGAMIAPTDEETAVGRRREIFEEIKSAMGLPAVPEIFRIMAHLPLYLETGWQRFKFAFLEDGELDTRTKWMIGLAVSASNNNKAMIVQCTERLKALGVSDAELAELMAVVDVTNGMNKVLKAARVMPGR